MVVYSANLQVIDCPCTKRNCPRHGFCADCRAYHLRTKRARAPYCERKRNWFQRLLDKTAPKAK